MFEEKHIPHRRAGERLLTFVRPHWIKLAKSVAFSILLFLLPVVLYYFLLMTMPFIFTYEPAYATFIMTGTVYYLIILLMLYNRFIDYHLDIWIVTNYRIIAIEQKNIFNRTVSEHLIELIQDVSANQEGMAQTVFNYGDVIIQTAAEEKRFHFDDVPDPFTIAKTINKLHSKKV